MIFVKYFSVIQVGYFQPMTATMQASKSLKVTKANKILIPYSGGKDNFSAKSSQSFSTAINNFSPKNK